MEENKKHFCDIENHVCCEDCMEVYMNTIDSPFCGDSIAIELEDKKCECDCGITFSMERCKDDYRMILIKIQL